MLSDLPGASEEKVGEVMDSCDCNLDGPTFLYAGKAIKMRNRLQRHVFASTSRRTSPWVDEYLYDPHSHVLSAAVWYLPYEKTPMAEAALLRDYKPKFNRQRGIVAGSKSLGKPDVIVMTEEIEPSYKKLGKEQVQNRPGVYIWFVDRKSELDAVSVFIETVLENEKKKANP